MKRDFITERNLKRQKSPKNLVKEIIGTKETFKLTFIIHKVSLFHKRLENE